MKQHFDDVEMSRCMKSLGEDVTVDKYMARHHRKFSKKDTVNRIKEFIEDNRISKDDMEIFKKIYGDHQILSKLVFVDDGSFCRHKILYKRGIRFFSNFYIFCDDLYQENKKEYEYIDAKDKLNYIKRNYEVIYIQLVSDRDARLY